MSRQLGLSRIFSNFLCELYDMARADKQKLLHMLDQLEILAASDHKEDECALLHALRERWVEKVAHLKEKWEEFFRQEMERVQRTNSSEDIQHLPVQPMVNHGNTESSSRRH